MFGQPLLSCHGAVHKNASYNLFCEELRLPWSLEYLKIITLPLPVQQLIFLPGISTLLHLLAILGHSISGSRLQPPQELVPWRLRVEMALWDSLRNPLAHEKKDVNLQGTPAIVP